MQVYSRFVGLPNSFKLALKLSFVFIVLVYFVFHAITGENGLFSYLDIREKVQKAENDLENLKKEKQYFEKITSLLSNKTLDLDILEERCRSILNYAYPDEIVIRNNGITH